MRQSLPPVDHVLAAIDHDNSLVRTLRAECVPGDLLGHAIVAAVAARSARRINQKTELLAELAGIQRPVEREAASWLASLGGDGRRRLSSLATTAAESLRIDLQEIEYEEDDSVRSRNMAELARSRERLEALQRLLKGAWDVDREPLRAQLRAADAVGERLITITPPLPKPGKDVVMVRATVIDAGRWWTRLVPVP